jgi:hypothetical protein
MVYKGSGQAISLLAAMLAATVIRVLAVTELKKVTSERRAA